MQALLLDTGGIGLWPTPLHIYLPGFLNPGSYFLLLLFDLAQRKKSRPRHLGCVHLNQVKLSLTMSTGNVDVTEKKTLKGVADTVGVKVPWAPPVLRTAFQTGLQRTLPGTVSVNTA